MLRDEIQDLATAALLPTPTTQDNSGQCRDHGGDLLHELTCGCARADRRALLPTPTVGHIRNHDEDIDKYLERKQKGIDGEYNGIPGISLGVAVRMEMLPTPLVDDSKNDGRNENRIATLTSVAYQTTTKQDWGRFEPAIRRWEQVTGRPAPAPTIADGRDGNHRLSPLFTEWLMGLESGHLTGIGLTRTEELKACGNGVVPQQAALALSLLDPEAKL